MFTQEYIEKHELPCKCFAPKSNDKCYRYCQIYTGQLLYNGRNFNHMVSKLNLLLFKHYFNDLFCFNPLPVVHGE